MTSEDITRWLEGWSEGDHAALDKVFSDLYPLIRAHAAHGLGNEPSDHTLQPTAVVNELYLRLRRQKGIRFSSRQNFLRFAAKSIRRVLIDYARGKRAAKRGGVRPIRIELSDLPLSVDTDVDMLALDQALDALGEHFPRHVAVVELRYFAGLTLEETAQTLDIAVSTVRRDWDFAKAFLSSQMES